MKYVILIHSNPQPWGHPTPRFTDEGRALSKERHDEMNRDFDALLKEISESGELVAAEGLDEPAKATVYTWGAAGALASDGPYAEAKEHLAGLFLIDCATRERAEQIAVRFASPGDTIELRPVWNFDDET